MPVGALAGWQAPANRRDPVEILIEQGKSRIEELLPVRYARMKTDPFVFLRGAAAIMAADFASAPATGFRLQTCGDCHLANFGAYATPEGNPVFDINDFDETLPAPFEWDVKRLAASLVVAGRVAQMPDAGMPWPCPFGGAQLPRALGEFGTVAAPRCLEHAHRSRRRDRRYRLGQGPSQAQGSSRRPCRKAERRISGLVENKKAGTGDQGKTAAGAPS